MATAQAGLAIAWTTVYAVLAEGPGELVPGMYLTAILVAFTRTDAQRVRQLALAAGAGYALSVTVRLLTTGSTVAFWGEVLQCLGVMGMLAVLARRARQTENQRHGLTSQVDMLQQEVERVTRNAERDHLTKSFNRQYILDALLREKARADRLGRGFSICIFDLDRFKSLNDEHGHLVGDRVLAVFASRARRALRSMDAINPTRFRRALGRLGGEEFIAVLPGTEVDGALRCAERVRDAVARHPVEQNLQITVSAGVAEYRHGESVPELLTRADQALYAAKRSGRNRVRVSAVRTRGPRTTEPAKPKPARGAVGSPAGTTRRCAARRPTAHCCHACRGRRATCRCKTELKIPPSRSSLVNSPVISARAFWTCSSSSASSSPARCSSSCARPASKWPRAAARLSRCRCRAVTVPSPRLKSGHRAQPLRAAPPGRRRSAPRHDHGALRGGITCRLARQVDLVAHDDHRYAGGTRPAAASHRAPASLASTTTSVEIGDRQLAARARVTPSRSTTSPVSRSPAVSTTCTGRPSISSCSAHQVAGRARHGRDDGGLVTGQPVEQAGLAAVRATGNHHVDAVPEQPPLARGRLDARELAGHRVQATAQLVCREEIDFLLGKVDGRLDVHAQRRHLLVQRRESPPKTPRTASAARRAPRRASRRR